MEFSKSYIEYIADLALVKKIFDAIKHGYNKRR